MTTGEGGGLHPCSFVVFGATGHLASTKLLPALFALERAGRIPAVTNFIAFARREHSDESWLRELEAALRAHLGTTPDATVWRRFSARFSYVQGDLNDVEAYRRLLDKLHRPRTQACSNTVFYLAIKPSDFAATACNLAAVGLNRPKGTRRIVVEKPFGEDLRSAQALNALLREHFDEQQIFRIDHYLGKETVQNLIVFRFANLLIEPLWNRNFIDHVQFTVAEDAGIETRADYYDRAGALRDMVQNHLLQLVTLIAMEPPAALEADALRDEKVKVLRSIRTIDPEKHVVRGQYAQGNASAAVLPSYLQEAGVPAQSRTETYVALKLLIDNWRWRGVPFYLRTGKRLRQHRTFIVIRFKHTPQQLFAGTMPPGGLPPNWVRLAIQPEERMELEIRSRQPGLGLHTREVRMSANYRGPDDGQVDAYEALLLDIIRCDPTNFIRFDEVEWAWRVVDPILAAWSRSDARPLPYPAGEDGPPKADRIFEWPYQRWEASA